jgi:AP endonuclease-1
MSTHVKSNYRVTDPLLNYFKHDGLEFVKSQNPDIFCTQETKCEKSKIPLKAEMKNYFSYWLSGDKNGYSGVGLMTRIKPIKVHYGISGLS